MWWEFCTDKKHGQCLIVAGGSVKYHLPLIALSDIDQVVRTAEGQLCIDDGTREGIQGSVGEQEWVTSSVTIVQESLQVGLR